MARPLRCEAAGAVYHVMARGDGGKPVFEDDKERHGWLDLMERACGSFGWRVHAWVLMGKHFHLAVERIRGTRRRQKSGVAGNPAGAVAGRRKGPRRGLRPSGPQWPPCAHWTRPAPRPHAPQELASIHSTGLHAGFKGVAVDQSARNEVEHLLEDDHIGPGWCCVVHNALPSGRDFNSTPARFPALS